MGRQIIEQPNGKYAIWSTIVDDFILEDITVEEYIEFRIQEETKQIKKDITEVVNKLKKGEKPYYQFTMTYEEALKLKGEIHGK